MSDDVGVLPRKKPRQQRSKEMVSAILEATARVLREGGADAVSTNRVAKIAGVSVGSLYQYFPNKEALIQALAVAHSKEQIARLGETMASEMASRPADVIRNYIRSAIVVHKEDPLLHLAVTMAMMTRGQELALQEHGVARDMVLAYILTHADQVDVPQPEHAAWILVTTVDMLIHTALFAEPARLDDPLFEAEIVRLVLRYVGLERVPIA